MVAEAANLFLLFLRSVWRRRRRRRRRRRWKRRKGKEFHRKVLNLEVETIETIETAAPQDD